MSEKQASHDSSLINSGNPNKNNNKIMDSTRPRSNSDKHRARLDYRPWGMCAFVANISILFLFSFTQSVYTIGVVRTIERRFGLSSKKSGLMMSVGDIAHIIIVTFVGYFGNKTHKPRFISITIIFSVAAGLLMALPYFLYSEDPVATLTLASNFTLMSFANDEINPMCGNGRDGDSICDQDIDVSENENAFYIFIVAQVLQGIGGAGVSTLSLAYVDENVNKESSSLYIGIITSVFGIGPIFGLLLGAVCLRLPENLQSSSVAVTDPNFIGAWWLGYVLCAVATALASIPLYFFPKYQTEHAPKIDEHETLVKQIKAYPRALWSLVTNKAYMCLLGTYVLSMYIVIGVFINIPRFLEIHFFQPSFVANVVAALPAVAGVGGGVLGGVIMARTRLKPPGAVLFVIGSLCTSIVGLVVISFFECPQLQMDGVVDQHGGISVETTCNTNCSCLTDKEHYRPVCGADQLTYFSPCHAGCETMINGTYTDCICVEGGTAEPGICLDSCSMIYPFAGVLLLMSLISSISRVPGTVIQFRVVDDDEKGFAISFTSFTVNLLVFIPGPILFGAMIDASCLLWQSTCDTIGSCLLYNTAMFRYVTYSTSAGLQALGLVFAVVLYLLIKNRDYSETEEVTVEADRPMQEEAAVPLKSDTF